VEERIPAVVYAKLMGAKEQVILLLNVSDLGLETANSLLKLSNCENCAHLLPRACRGSAVGPPSSSRRAPRRMPPRR
jgi:hypothetical protein